MNYGMNIKANCTHCKTTAILPPASSTKRNIDIECNSLVVCGGIYNVNMRGVKQLTNRVMTIISQSTFVAGH